MPARRLFLTLLLLMTALPAAAQVVVRGTVADADTGAPLAAATVHVEGTYRGTITNADGVFELQVPDGPSVLVVRYIGYATARIAVEGAERLAVRLEPVAYTLGEVVVTGEDPAVRIMREVIERKQRWRAALTSYRAEAYNRFTLRNDTGIVSITESLTDAFWDRDEGMREVVKARRETANFYVDEALPAAFFVTNLYDDDIEISGHRLIGVTHPDALRHYDFRLVGTRRLDDRTVYDITVTPRNRRKSAFEGQVAVLDSAFALLGVELRPGPSFRFPAPIERFDVTYRQQFSNSGGDFWLPVDFRAEIVAEVKMGPLLAFPAFHVDQVSRFTDYVVNVALPDSLFASDDLVRVDSVALAGENLLEADGAAVPLSAPERVAYAGIDSTMGLETAFAPTGMLARFVRTGSGEGSASASVGGGSGLLSVLDVQPVLWYNRADALHAGLRLGMDAGRYVRLRGGGGFSTGPDGADRWSYRAGVRAETRGAPEVYADASYEARTALRYGTDLYNRLVNSVGVLLGGADYFDYYRAEGIHAEAGVRLDVLDATLAAGLRRERHRPLGRTTSYDLLGQGEPLRPNPRIGPADLHAVSVRLAAGDDFDPFGFFGRRRLVAEVEHSPGGGFGSDFEYTRFSVLADVRVPTFYRRRLIPNALDLRIAAGASSGTLPAQRVGTVDGTLGVYAPFGALKTLGGRPYEGDRWLGVFWEHHFRTVPFERIGLEAAVERDLSLIVFGGHGRTWLDDAESAPAFYAPRVPGAFHHEVGIGLSGLLGFLRVDAAFRLDAPGVGIGVAAARIF
ncbi:MAG: DUF5686 family protein [Rhodothermales bacterium]|nr:DUF5686 family protein [Rhodothermales bacterium]